MAQSRTGMLAFGLLAWIAPLAWAQVDVGTLRDRQPATGDRLERTDRGDATKHRRPPHHPQDCLALTIARGEISGYGADIPGFDGAELLIQTPVAWHAFWALHAPDAEIPPVNFHRYAVLAAIQGPQTSGGGPNVTIAHVATVGRLTRVRIVDDRRPGPLDVITNPFHIVQVPRQCLEPSVAFNRVRPAPHSAVLSGRVSTMMSEGELRPLPGVHVALAPSDATGGGGSGDAMVRRAISGRDGTYVFVNVPPGEYVLRAMREGFTPFHRSVSLGSGLNHEPIVLQRSETGQVAGSVFGLGGGPMGMPMPLAGAELALLRNREQIAVTETADDGTYSFDEIPPGAYVLIARAHGFHPQAAPIEVHPGETTEQEFVLEQRHHQPPDDGHP